MLHPLEPEKASRIVSGVLEACRDITRLPMESYRWLHLRAGFIAHFDRDGFIEEYQSCQNLRDNILANQIHNTSCSRSHKDVDYPYYLQQCEMYNEIVEKLLADPMKFTQQKRTDDFCLELVKDRHQDIHQLNLITKRGTSSVFCNKEFLINLQNNISLHLMDPTNENV